MAYSYLAPEPVKELEDWFLKLLKAAFPPSVFVVLGYKGSAEATLIPQSHVTIIYSGYSGGDNSSFKFQIEYQAHGVANLNPHRDSLALAEAGRFALWQKVPPRPANAFQLRLLSEKYIKSKDCGCKPGLVQEWECYGKAPVGYSTNPDPCSGFGEPDSVIPAPLDYITPFNNQWYFAVNPQYVPNGMDSPYVNAPWVFSSGSWVLNESYDKNKPTVWPNIQVILKPYVSSINVQHSPN